MVSPHRPLQQLTELKEQLRNSPQAFDFFQAVRLLRILHLTAEVAEPRQPVGGDGNPEQEIVRFRSHPSLRFPAHPIRSISGLDGPMDESAGVEMVVTFMGLGGPLGVLPRHYTQLLLDRIREQDAALRDFLDFFNHRVISLFYRAWEKYRFPIVYESSALQLQRRGEDLFTRCLYGITGLGLPSLRNRLQASDELFLFYGGLLANRPPTVVSLEAILVDFLGLPTGVLQFQGQWLYLTKPNRTALSSAGKPSRHNNHLGHNAVLGERVWDVQNKFRVRIGPLTYQQFRRFMPDGDRLTELCQVVRSYVGPGYDFDVQPVLRSTEVPRCRLSDTAASPSRLGWNTWLRSAPLPRDAEDAVFVHEGAPSR